MGKGKKKSGTLSTATSEVVAVENADKTINVDTAPEDSGRSETPVEDVEQNGDGPLGDNMDSADAAENASKDTPTVPEPRVPDDQRSEQQTPEPEFDPVHEVAPKDQYVEISTAKTWDDPTPLSQSGLIPAESKGTNGETTDAPSGVPASPRLDEDYEEEEEDEDDATHISRLEQELETTRAEKEQLGTKYSNLLSKLTMMRQSLGDRLRDDAEELDRREALINQLTGDLAAAKESLGTLQEELQSSADECSQLSSQVTQLRLSASTQTSDVLSLTRELRELRGEMEMLRVDREEWEHEAGRERERREEIEEEMRAADRQRREDEARRRSAEEALERERVRANNLQEVLQEFQSGMFGFCPNRVFCADLFAAKDLEIEQATMELEHQLRQAVQSLAEWKTRAADAEVSMKKSVPVAELCMADGMRGARQVKMTNVSSDITKTAQLEKEIKEKNAQIGRLRHEAVLTQEHLTEALRRLRRNTSDTNVDRRLVTNVLLQFIATPRADPKKFEMLSLLATILSWEDSERERAGLQRAGGGSTTPGKKAVAKRKESDASQAPGQKKTQQEQDEFNESFSDLFVEFLLKEAAQGQKPSPATNQQSALPSPGLPGVSSPTIGNSGLFGRQRTYSNSSMTSNVSGSFSRPNFITANSHPNHYSQQNPNGNMNLNLNLGSGTRSPQYMGGMQRKGSFSAQHMMGGAVMDRDGYTSPRGSISGPSWRN
ncbi:hypothetical protein QFC22_002731 [Naganishia vaughanmartiniae]|uniref:Uncharacterized protein n=1 Tax=Naganishia vaughanmartiniae TaxID=1424756 RepID=A0ACC2XDI5_9TREE|nr:hypothetical protein QFC22_002731 [Naganishia vaughanmartiniae]